MRTLIIYLFFFVAASASYAGNLSVEFDSVGIEKIDGKLYVIHEVEEKETLYALSRRYGASVKDIIAANPATEDGLEIGQRIRIPWKVQEVTNQKNVNNAKFHKVAQGETLFSISRKYDVKVGDIKKWNSLTSNSLEIGQRLKIGEKSSDAENDKAVEQSKDIKTNELIHVVKQSETLFSISRSTGVSVDQIKEWNNLSDNTLSIGQELIIGVKETKDQVKEEVRQTTSENVVETEADNDPFKDSRVTDESTEEGDVNSQANETKEPEVRLVNESGKIEKIDKEKTTNFEEVNESGLAELIEGSANTRKYLALHRTANIGTIMKVRNEMNGQEVFVRVLGKLPDTDINENVLIKISKAAYNRLGAIDQKFRVSISYIP